jgi:hypothetical protein
VKDNSALFGLFRGTWVIFGPTWDQDEYKTAIFEPRCLFLREEKKAGGRSWGFSWDFIKHLGGVLRGLGRRLGSSDGDVQGI